MTTQTTTQTITSSHNSFTLAAGNEISISSASPNGFAVYAPYAAGFAPTFSNQGTVISTNTSAPYNGGVKIAGDDYVPGTFGDNVTNGGISNTSALISGERYGVDFEAGPGGSNNQVINYGTIEDNVNNGGFNAGVVFGYRAGGDVTNFGVIEGNIGSAIVFKTSSGGAVPDTVINSGSLESAAGAVSVIIQDGNSSATVTNTGFISNGLIVDAETDESTITNFGTIGTIGGGGANTNIAVFNINQGVLDLGPAQSVRGGIVVFGAGSALELSGTPGSVGTLANPGSYFGFTSLTVESGADWNLGGSVAGVGTIADLGTLNITGLQNATPVDLGGNNPTGSVLKLSGFDDVRGGTIATDVTGFGTGDTIVVGGANLSGNGAQPGDVLTKSYDPASKLLTISDSRGGSNLFNLTVNVSGPNSSSASNFGVATGPGGAVVITDIPCFAAGTRILTETGQVAVEALRAGDTVLGARDGLAKKIIWVGRRTIDLARHADPEKVMPVRILAGAFGPGLPERDLVLSPDHALYLAEHLIEAKTLVNGATIIRDGASRHVTYHHIELEKHDVLVAEGLMAESYLESGNRGGFEDGAGAIALHPDFVAKSRELACAKLLLEGRLLTGIRQKLLDRAMALGFQRTEDVDLVGQVGAERVRAEDGAPGQKLFALPAGAKTIALLSGAGVPAELNADPSDRRRLGVAISGLALIVDGRRRVIDLADERHEGFHAAETGHRWTNGAARISLPAYRGRAVLEVTMNGQAARWMTARHWLASA